MASYVENANRVKNANDAIKQAIIDKGVTPTGNLESYADAISNISGGTDISDTTATAEDVLVGKQFHTADGTLTEGSMEKLSSLHMDYKSNAGSQAQLKLNEDYEESGYVDENTYLFLNTDKFGDARWNNVLKGKKFSCGAGINETGSMPDNAAVSKTLDATTTSYTVPEGYHNGKGTVSVSTQTKSVSPSTSAQTVYPDAGKVLSAVTVNGIPVQTKSVTPSSSAQTVYPDAGYFLSAVTVGAASTAKVASGTFTTMATSQFISCGFKPTRVMVLTNMIPSGTQGFLQLCQYWEGQNNAIVIQNLTNNPARNSNEYITPVDGGFNFVGNTNTASSFQGRTAYYIAVG